MVKVFRLCMKYLLHFKYIFLVYIFLMLIIATIKIVSPYVTGDFLDTLIAANDINVVINFCIIFGALNLLRILIGYTTSLIYIKMQMSMGHEFNRDVLLHIQKLPLSLTQQKESSYLTQKVNNDCNELIIFCLSFCQNAIVNAIMLIAPFILLFSMNWLISVVFIAFLVIYVLLFHVFKNPLHKSIFAFKENMSKYFSSLYEQLSYIKLIKLNSVQSEINKRLDSSFDTLMVSGIMKQKINYLFSGLDDFTTILAQIVLFIIGGFLILSGNFTIGMFTIFSGYFNLMISSTRYFFNLSSTYQSALVSHNRIMEILSEDIEVTGPKIPEDILKIKLSNICFSFKDRQVLNGFSAYFEKGNIYGIVGENGAGKSTLLYLIMGLYSDRLQGQIEYNDTAINELDMVKVRKRFIAFSEQEPELVNDTITYNLSFKNEQFSLKDEERIYEFARILGLEHFISESFKGFIINEDNTNTSGGEKQKLSILKVLYKDTPIMIFDEPTSALDSISSKKFIQYLQHIKANKIIIIVTHDEYVRDNCDFVLQHRSFITHNRAA